MSAVRAIEHFLPRVLFWLGPLFVLWYVLSPLLLWPAAGWVHWVLTLGFSDAIAGVERHGTLVEVVTRMAVATTANSLAASNAVGTLTFELDGLKYFYGWPLLMALTLAAPTPPNEKAWRAAMGAFLVLLVPIWGLSAEALKVLVFQMDPVVGIRLGFGPLSRELLALAYQLGYLILPAVAPILLWAALHRDFVARLLPHSVALPPTEHNTD